MVKIFVVPCGEYKCLAFFRLCSIIGGSTRAVILYIPSRKEACQFLNGLRSKSTPTHAPLPPSPPSPYHLSSVTTSRAFIVIWINLNSVVYSKSAMCVCGGCVSVLDGKSQLMPLWQSLGRVTAFPEGKRKFCSGQTLKYRTRLKFQT